MTSPVLLATSEAYNAGVATGCDRRFLKPGAAPPGPGPGRRPGLSGNGLPRTRVGHLGNGLLASPDRQELLAEVKLLLTGNRWGRPSLDQGWSWSRRTPSYVRCTLSQVRRTFPSRAITGSPRSRAARSSLSALTFASSGRSVHSRAGTGTRKDDSNHRLDQCSPPVAPAIALTAGAGDAVVKHLPRAQPAPQWSFVPGLREGSSTSTVWTVNIPRPRGTALWNRVKFSREGQL
jgi:hypothetical protein